MSKHFLSLMIPDTSNSKCLTIVDESIYDPIVPITCEQLEVYIPGYNKPVYIDVVHNFRVNLTACILGIQRVDCGKLQGDIPDGIYVIRYSVSPNDKVYVEYNYLRITGVLNAYNKILGNINLTPSAPDFYTNSELKELTLINYFIKAAKIKVEEENKPQEGINLLSYAVKRLKKLGDIDCQF